VKRGPVWFRPTLHRIGIASPPLRLADLAVGERAQIVQSILEVPRRVEELRRAVRQGVDGHGDPVGGVELVLGEVAAGIERSGQIAGGIVERRGPVRQLIDRDRGLC
jgi:hypothetical protein